MIQRELINKRTGEKIIMFEDGDFEYEKPVKHYGDGFIIKKMVLRGIPNDELNGDQKPTEKSKQIFKEATIKWQEMLQKFKATQLPSGLIDVLNSTKKAEQEQLLKGQVLTPDILMGLLIKAEDMGS